MTMTNIPEAVQSAHSGRKGLPVWGWLLIGFGCLFGATILGLTIWGMSIGLGAFEDDALIVMNGNPVINRHIGEIETAKLDMLRSGMLPGINDFAFKLKGSRGSGKLEAEFITTIEGERLGKGELRMDNGRSYRLPAGD